MPPLPTWTDAEHDYPDEVRLLVGAMASAMVAPEKSGQAKIAFQDTAACEPELFFQASCQFLESVADSPQRNRAYLSVLACPAFLIELTRKERYSLPRLTELCRQFAAIDKRFDIRLADLLPGRTEDRHKLDPEAVARILEVLNEISVGPRLILLLSHLTHDPHPKVAEKATVLMGRRVCNTGWSQRRLESGVPEIRAGVVQGLWGRNTKEARLTMRQCLKDSSERVAGNAVFGLHLLGEPDVPQLVEGLMADQRPPFRATAAWVAGQIGEPQYSGLLMRAKDDNEASVRLAAKQAMVKLRQEARLAEEALKTEPAEPPAAVEAPPAAQPSVSPDTAVPPHNPVPPEAAGTPGAAGPERNPQRRELDIRLDGSVPTTRWG